MKRCTKPLIRVVLAMGLAAVLLTGCSQTHLIRTGASDEAFPVDRARVDRELAGEDVTVDLRDGTRIRATMLDISADSVTVISSAAKTGLRTLPLAEVDRIRRTRHRKGAVQGLGIGAIVGTAAGGILGAIGYEGEDDFLFDSRAEAMLGGALIINLVTSPIGLSIGLARGHRETYQIQPAETATQAERK
jgi:hypothetical protein